MRKPIFRIVTYIFLLAILAFAMLPLVYTIFASFKTNMEILTNPGSMFPKKFTFDNYVTAWNSENFRVGPMVLNSTIYTLFNVVITILTSSMAGYVFARGNFRGKKIIFGCFLSLMFIQVGGISIYAVFDVLNLVNLTSSLFSLMIVKMFGVQTMQLYLVKGYVETLPKELDEAAEIDGCSFFKIYYKIIMPLLLPILATVGMLSFQASWNEYLMPTIFTVSMPSQQTLIVGLMALKSSSGAATQWNLMLAGSVIALFPVLVAYGFGNQFFISGLSAGAVKG